MLGFIVRVLVIVGVVALLWMQARAAEGQPHRQRGFRLAALAILTIAAAYGTIAAGGQMGTLQMILGVVGLLLLAGALASIVISLRSGEMNSQREQIAAAAQEYRERRGKQRR